MNGSAILFRGDFPHAGASYKETHNRLFVSLLVTGIEHKNNGTEYHVFDKQYCGFPECNVHFDTKRERTDHKQYCDFNPDKAVLESKRKNRNQGLFKCKCTKVHKS